MSQRNVINVNTQSTTVIATIFVKLAETIFMKLAATFFMKLAATIFMKLAATIFMKLSATVFKKLAATIFMKLAVTIFVKLAATIFMKLAQSQQEGRKFIYAPQNGFHVRLRNPVCTFKENKKYLISMSKIDQLIKKSKGTVHPKRCHEGPEEQQRYSSILSLMSALETRVGGERYALTALPPGVTHYTLGKGLGGRQGRSARVRKISPPPAFHPRTVQHVASHYTD
jgi:hypothetical protein